MSNLLALYRKNLKNMPVIGKLNSINSDYFKAQIKHKDEINFEPVSINQFIVINSISFAIIAKVKELNYNSENLVNVILSPQATINFVTENLEFQVEKYPYIGDTVSKVSPELIRNFIESNISDDALCLEFANLVNADNASFQISPERLFGRHLAILGTTGSGKSWSIAKIIEESAKFKSKIILIDATGEFDNLNYKTKHLKLGGENIEGCKNNILPYFQLTEDDVIQIFKPEADIQDAKLRSAIKSLKIASLEPKISLDGLIVKAHKDKTNFQKAYSKHYVQVQNNLADFDISLLSKQIQNECVHYSRSVNEANIWGAFDRGDIASCTSLIDRIETIIHSEEFKPIFQTYGKISILEEITYFLKDEDLRVLCISLKDLAFSNNIRQVVVNALCRFLMKIARKHFFNKNPLVLFIDEAHQFLTEDQLFSDLKGFNSLESIAREGRKYALTLCLATQRPRDLPGHIFSQIGNLLVHRVVNELDRKSIESASSSVDTTVLNKLPSLGSGEACILGVDFRYPILIKTKKPKNPPIFFGPDYSSKW